MSYYAHHSAFFASADLAVSASLSLHLCSQHIYEETRRPFVVVIDEWDCIFRECGEIRQAQDEYLDFLRDMLKDREYIHLAYMTGILPIKKYGTHSALNMFLEFSMTNPRQFAPYVGFTDEEVRALCEKFNRNFEEIREWYDGYYFGDGQSVYAPKSVVEAVLSGVCDTYWNQTEIFEALRSYIDMNFDGLRDDVLTLLIHLGYLGYNFDHECVFIPNNEIRRDFYNAVSVSEWGEVSKALLQSAATLEAIWAGREKQVAEGIELAHFETAHIQYNDENALSYTISLALYTARNFYTVVREMPTGKGFADMVYIPRKKFSEKPALVVELKWDKSAKGAIEQIKRKNYCRSLEEFQGNILLVGINYDKETKEHSCIIEEHCRNTAPNLI